MRDFEAVKVEFVFLVATKELHCLLEISLLLWSIPCGSAPYGSRSEAIVIGLPLGLQLKTSHSDSSVCTEETYISMEIVRKSINLKPVYAILCYDSS